MFPRFLPLEKCRFKPRPIPHPHYSPVGNGGGGGIPRGGYGADTTEHTSATWTCTFSPVTARNRTTVLWTSSVPVRTRHWSPLRVLIWVIASGLSKSN